MKEQAIKIVKKLQEAGYTAYFAGGAVRDMLLRQDSLDYDIATSATPEQIENLFEKTIPVGKQFGIIMVVEGDETFEVATFRAEGDYLDSRRPSHVHFTDDKEDAIRRDFTVNGLFFDPIKNKVIDYVGGEEDIKKKTIRFIGNPVERIEEDNLRLIRAIRFKITLGFQYDQSTFDAVRNLHHLIKTVSAERIRDELNKIMSSPNRHVGLVELSESGLLQEILPEVEKLKGVPQPIEYHHEGDVFTHIYLALKSLEVSGSSHLAWAIMLHDIGKPVTLIREGERIIFHDHARVSAKMAKEILERLKFPKFEILEICWLIEHHMSIVNISAMRQVKRLNFLTDSKFPDLIRLARADAMGTYPANLDLSKKLEQEVKAANEEKSRLNGVKPEKLFGGADLISMGFEPNEKFTEMLEDINDRLLSGELKSKEEAMGYAKGKYKNEL